MPMVKMGWIMCSDVDVVMDSNGVLIEFYSDLVPDVPDIDPI